MQRSPTKTLFLYPGLLLVSSSSWLRSLRQTPQHRLKQRLGMSSTEQPVVSDDALFRQIERQQQGTFGRVLDAGTGWHSLRWLLSLGSDVEHVTAVTADRSMRKQCQRDAEKMLGRDAIERCTILCGNWFPSASSDSSNTEDIVQQLSKEEKFDVILADYLIGALDGFSPYQQDLMLPKLISLLKPHTGRLYIVGLEPIPDQPPALSNSHATEDDVQNHHAAAVVCQIRQVRDACILLAGHRCYREYPRDWVVRNVHSAGGVVRHSKTFPILYRHATLLKQINVGRSKLPYMPESVREAMQRRLDELEEESLRVTSQLSTGRIRLGFDYIVTVEAKPSIKASIVPLDS